MQNQRLRSAKLQRARDRRKDYERRHRINLNAPSKQLENAVVPIYRTAKKDGEIFDKDGFTYRAKIGEKEIPQKMSRHIPYRNKDGNLVHFIPYPQSKKFMVSRATKKQELTNSLERLTSPAITH